MKRESIKKNKEPDAEIDFLGYLKRIFENRCKKNPSYSLRSFAKSLGVHPSILSSILKGKRTITQRLKRQLGLAIGIKASDLHFYTTEEERVKKVSSTKLSFIDDAKFSILSDWYYYAILELFELSDFKSNVKWIASKLNLNVNQVNIALGNLEKCGFIDCTQNNDWCLRDTQFTTHLVPLETSLAKKSYQKQLLKLSYNSVEDCPLELRDHTSVVFSIDKTDLDEARKLTQDYRRKMISLFNKSAKKTDIYQLQISLFPLTNSFKEN